MDGHNSDLPTSAGPADAGGLPMWFQRVYNEIEEIRAALYAKKGILFLKVHQFSKDQILSYPAFVSMRTLCAQIDSSFGRWRMEGSVSDQTYQYYHDARLDIERRMGALRADILQRNPTMLETIGEFFSKAIRLVLNVLPLIPTEILRRIGLAPSHQGRLSKFDGELDNF